VCSERPLASSYFHEVFMILRSPTEHENGDFRHAGMDSRHQVRKDASGNIHVSLDSSTPCWNDAIEAALLEVTEVSLHLFSKQPYFVDL
jgi:hypothetical protein